LHNNRFAYWQRVGPNLFGSFVTEMREIACDRWMVNWDGGVSPQVIQQRQFFTSVYSPTSGDNVPPPSRPLFGMRQKSGAAQDYRVSQRLAGVPRTAGRTYTLSAWVRDTDLSLIAGQPIYVQPYVVQRFKLGSEAKTLFGPPVEITVDWQRLTATATLSTLPSGPLDQVYSVDESFYEVGFEFTGNTGRYLTISDAQLEEGEIATPVEGRLIVDEENIVETRYETSRSVNNFALDVNLSAEDAIVVYANPDGSYGLHVRFSTTKSKIPEIKLYDELGADVTNDWQIVSVGYRGFNAARAPVAGDNPPLLIHWSADAEERQE